LASGEINMGSDENSRGLQGTSPKPKGPTSVDPFHPTQIRNSTRVFGALAVGYLMVSLVVEAWPLLAGADGATAPEDLYGVLAILGVFAAALVWLGVEIWLSQRGWASVLVFVLTTISAISDLILSCSISRTGTG
jgi:hypothetical protein